MEEHSRTAQDSWSPRVVDVSVMLKWFLVGEDTPKALALLVEHERKERTIVIPTLAIYEFIDRIQQSYSFLPFERIQSWIQQIYDPNLNLHIVLPLQSQVEKAISLALQKGASASASIYTVIARAYGAELITANTTPYQNLQTYISIISLRDLTLPFLPSVPPQHQ